MNQLRVGIIGLGVGRKHLDIYRNHPGCRVTAVCDYSDEKLSAVKDQYPSVATTKTAAHILESPDIDVVSIASYDNDHYPQICSALNHHKHVFVEKPVCLYEQEAFSIRALLKKHSHLKLSTNLVLRHSPRFQHLKSLIDSGEMGELFHVEGDYNYGRLQKITEGWRGDLDFYSVMYGGGIHMVDLLLWLTGDVVTDVCAFGNNIASRETKFRYNDMAVGILKFKSGLVGKVSANFGCVMPHFHQLAVYGTKATFINGYQNAYLYQSRNPQAQPKLLDTAYPGTHQGELISNFIDAVMTDTMPEISPDEIFKTMSVCFAIETSMTRSSATPVNYL